MGRTMEISVEISMYPLKDGYVPAIEDFITGLNQYDDIEVTTNLMSTQVFGPADVVFAALQEQMARVHDAYGKSVFVCKFVNGDLNH